jgi:hypothetical protein
VFTCAALLVGCAHAHVEVQERDVAPVSYEPLAGATLERTTGRLRRLAVVMVPFEASPHDPRWCMDPCDVAAYGHEVEARGLALLEDWRGYELVRLDVPPTFDRENLAALGRTLGVDGVLVLRGRYVYLTWLDGLSWYVTLTFSIPISMARLGPRAEAEIYETASGRLVWRSRVRGAGDTTGAELADALLEPLELAWPRALTRPAAPPR